MKTLKLAIAAVILACTVQAANAQVSIGVSIGTPPPRRVVVVHEPVYNDVVYERPAYREVVYERPVYRRVVVQPAPRRVYYRSGYYAPGYRAYHHQKHYARRHH
jgi:hypothetical protein